jgi:hypothetical protein
VNMLLPTERHTCVRCGDSFSRNAWPFGQLLACGPLCAACLDNVLEHARSWGGDEQEFGARVRRRLDRPGYDTWPRMAERTV